MVHGRAGPAPQTAKRELFKRLIARGISNAEALSDRRRESADREALATRARPLEA
jgi:hypothetical protein